MAKREWGAKHTCTGCGVKFYDLHRKPIACPKCGDVVEVEIVRPNRRRPPAQPEPPKPVPSPSANRDPDIEAAADETDDASDEVIADIDSDDDDVLVDGIDKAAPAQPEP